MQRFQDFARKQIFLKSRCFYGVSGGEGFDKSTRSCRWFQQAGGRNSVFTQYRSKAFHECGRGVKRCQDGLFQAVHIAVVPLFVRRLLADDAVQFGNQGEKFHFGLRPPGCVFERAGGIEYALQSAETAVTGENFSFCRHRFALFVFEQESGFYCFNIVG